MNKYIKNYLNIINTVHYIHLVFLHLTFHAPIVYIPLHYILLHVLAPSSGSIIFNSSILGTTRGSKHLSKRVGKMQDEVLLAAIKQGSFESCDTIYVSWEARVDKVTRLLDGRFEILFPTEATDFFFYKTSTSALGPTNFPAEWVMRFSFSWG